MKIYKKVLRSAVSLVALAAILALNMPLPVARAAALTAEKDTLSTIETTVNANHTIQWLQTTAITQGMTMTITFPSDFSLTGVAEAAGASDFDLAEDTDGSPTSCSGTLTEETLDASQGATAWGVGVSGQVVTFTAPSNSATYIAAGSCLIIEIGTHALNEFTGVNQINNATTTGSKVITIASASSADSGSLAVSLVADDSVNVTANVDPSITFTISDTTIGFGTLSTSAATWANGATTGSASDTSAHTMALATNANSGYAITYNGATLTAGGSTIDVASITNDADGTPGSEQFGMGFSTDGNATIAAAYDHNATPGSRDWAFVASTTTTVVSESVPTLTETISAFYLANIAATTEPGSYATNITYIATGTF